MAVSMLINKIFPTKNGHLFLTFPALQSMPVFENYPENVLHELTQYALYDSFLANVTRKFLIPPPYTCHAITMCTVTLAS